jgi:hypothetical protein
MNGLSFLLFIFLMSPAGAAGIGEKRKGVMPKIRRRFQQLTNFIHQGEKYQ